MVTFSTERLVATEILRHLAGAWGLVGGQNLQQSGAVTTKPWHERGLSTRVVVVVVVVVAQPDCLPTLVRMPQA